MPFAEWCLWHTSFRIDIVSKDITIFPDNLSDQTLVLWSVKGCPLGTRNFQERSCCVWPQQPRTSKVLISAGHMPLFRSCSPHISRPLANWGCQQPLQSSGHSAYASSDPGQGSKLKTGKQEWSHTDKKIWSQWSASAICRWLKEVKDGSMEPLNSGRKRC